MQHLRQFLPTFNRDQWWIFTSFCLWGFTFGLWLHLQPLYIEFLGAEPEQVGYALGLAGLGVVFLYIPMGLMADRWRRKPIMVGGWIVGTVSIFMMAVAPDWRWVIPGMALYLFASFSRPAVAGYVAASDTSGNVSQVFAYMSAGFSFGAIAAPALGGWIAEQWSLRMVFYFAGIVGIFSTVAMAKVRDVPAPAPAQQAEIHPRRLLTDRPFMWQIFVFFLIVFALEVGTVLLPNYLQEVKGLSIQQIGQMGTISSIGMFLFMLGLGSMRSDRLGSIFLIQIVVVVSLVLLLLAPSPTTLYLAPLLLIGYFLRGATWAIWPITRGRMTHWLDPQVISLGFGFLDTVSQLARTLAPFVAGLLYAYQPTSSLYGGLIALGLTLALTMTIPHSRQKLVAETSPSSV